MTEIAAMLDAYPAPLDGIDRDTLILCVQECVDCAQTAAACADACMADADTAELSRCAATALVCADIAATAARTLVRHHGRDTAVVRTLLQSCVEACRRCGDECRRHALRHEHCRICAESCRRCAHMCQAMRDRLP